MDRNTNPPPPAAHDANSAPTVEVSLDILSAVVGKAAEDLTAVHGAIDAARHDIRARNTAASREVLLAATRAVNHLRFADLALKDVIRELSAKE